MLLYLFRKNPKFIQCIANRSACQLSLFNYRECISDCNEILNQIASLPENESDPLEKLKIRMKSRKAVCLSFEGINFDLAERTFKEALEEAKKVNEDLEKEINAAFERFKKRKDSLNIKVKC